MIVLKSNVFKTCLENCTLRFKTSCISNRGMGTTTLRYTMMHTLYLSESFTGLGVQRHPLNDRKYLMEL